MRILDHPQHWLVLGRPDQPLDQGGQRTAAALLRRQHGGRRAVAVGRVQVQQGPEQHDRLGCRRRPVRAGEPRLDPCEPVLRRLVDVDVDAGRVRQVLDGGMQRRAGVVR